MKIEKIPKHRIIFLILILSCSPLFLGWQKLDMQDFFATAIKPAAVQENGVLHPQYSSKPPETSPYKIIERSITAFSKLKAVRADVEVWQQNPVFHLRGSLVSYIKNADDSKTEGRVSFSIIAPSGFSTSQWVQTYKLGGISFTWNGNKKEWEKEEYAISNKEASDAIAYSMIEALFSIQENNFDLSSMKLSAVEKRNGNDCYILSYKLKPEIFKRWNTVGNISTKLWVDINSYLPVLQRLEGVVGDITLLEEVSYSKYNETVEFNVPDVIAQQLAREKKEIEGKFPSIVEFVAKLRGWNASVPVKFEFIDRVSFRDYIEGEVSRDYPGTDLETSGFVNAWLGLARSGSDYKQALINEQVSSIAAMYDPKEKKILVGNWVGAEFLEPVLAHEITHAFQDNLIGIDGFIRGGASKQDLDMMFARMSAVEGDATAVMLEYILNKTNKRFMDLADIFSFIEDKMLKGSPDSRDNVLYNIYGYGANFIQAYLQNNRWNEIDKLYKSPASSMAEIMHPTKFFLKKEGTVSGRRDKDAMAIETFDGFRPLGEFRLGEFVILLSLRKFMDKDASERLVERLLKDKLNIYENGAGQKLILFKTQWASPESAAEFNRFFKEWLGKKYASIKIEETKDLILAQTPAQGFFALKADKDAVLVVWSDTLNEKEFDLIRQKAYAN